MNAPHEEKEIVLSLLNGNEDAFEQLYRAYSPRLFGKLLQLVKSEVYAKEILQDVFLKIWEYRKSIDPDKSFRSFLFKIAENKVYDFFRKTAREKNIQSELIAIATTDYFIIEELQSGNENLTILHKAIDRLPPQRQQVFRLGKLEGKSYKEIGEQLGISASTISDHIVKATKSIRDYFDNNNHRLMTFVMVILMLRKP